jgi:hypothetical protein
MNGEQVHKLTTEEVIERVEALIELMRSDKCAAVFLQESDVFKKTQLAVVGAALPLQEKIGKQVVIQLRLVPEVNEGGTDNGTGQENSEV